MPADTATKYTAITAGVGLVDCSDRTQIEVTGDDRRALLHNLTTNDIRNLQVGEGCEAFALDLKGHVLGHLTVYCTPETLILDSVAGEAARLIGHFERYHIREQVEFHDRSSQQRQWLVAGAGAAALLARLGGIALAEPVAPETAKPRGWLSHGGGRFSGHHVWWRRVEFAGPSGFLIAGQTEAVAAAVADLQGAGAIVCDPETSEIVRIEAHYPRYGVDITAENLPQEIGRDALAINFKKGCYLGQETVARIDALGHVNRQLAALRLDGSAVPAAGAELRGRRKSSR